MWIAHYSIIPKVTLKRDIIAKMISLLMESWELDSTLWTSLLSYFQEQAHDTHALSESGFSRETETIKHV